MTPWDVTTTSHDVLTRTPIECTVLYHRPLECIEDRTRVANYAGPPSGYVGRRSSNVLICARCLQRQQLRPCHTVVVVLQPSTTTAGIGLADAATAAVASRVRLVLAALSLPPVVRGLRTLASTAAAYRGAHRTRIWLDCSAVFLNFTVLRLNRCMVLTAAAVDRSNGVWILDTIFQ